MVIKMEEPLFPTTSTDKDRVNGCCEHDQCNVRKREDNKTACEHSCKSNDGKSSSNFVECIDDVLQGALLNLEDSDSEADNASVQYIDDLSTMAELRLEECSVDSCSINSHTLCELDREEVKQGKESDESAVVNLMVENENCSSSTTTEHFVGGNEDVENVKLEKSEHDDSDTTITKDEGCDNFISIPTDCSSTNEESSNWKEEGGISKDIYLDSDEDNNSNDIRDSLNRTPDIETESLRHENVLTNVDDRSEILIEEYFGSETKEVIRDSSGENEISLNRTEISESDPLNFSPSFPRDVEELGATSDSIKERDKENSAKVVTFSDISSACNESKDESEFDEFSNSKELVECKEEVSNPDNCDEDIPQGDHEESLKHNCDLSSITIKDEPIFPTVTDNEVLENKEIPKKKNPDSGSSRSSRSSRSSTVSGPWTNEERLYEDIADLVSPSSGSHHSNGNSNDGEDAQFFSRRLQVHRQFSSSDSWGSEDYDSYSSNEEEEKVPAPLSNGPENFKQRLLRKREQWRERRQSSRNLKFSLRKDSKESTKESKENLNENDNADIATTGENKENRLYRWFSLRKSNYDVERKSNTFTNSGGVSAEKGITTGGGGGGSSYTMTNGCPPPSSSLLGGGNSLHGHVQNQSRVPRLLEEDQEGVLFDARVAFESALHHRRYHQPPTLPPMPQGLSPEQIKRRHIVASIVHSENNYVATLHKLVNDYKKPLEESRPPILNASKLNTLFYRVPEILQSHTVFRIALSECVKQWDKEEKIGDVFVASFSNAIVLDVYSDFINNFSRAMEVAKQESKKKSAFADFLKMRQITSNDRLSFFGLMVKPIQRFPQFILFLQDLLKHTPQGHHDRMSLQLALTQLESLAEMLNERKREAEQYQAFRDTLKHINTKFALRGLGDGNRYLLRQDNVTQLEFNQNGMISKTKDRRLFLTNDLVLCVSVVPKSGDDFLHHGERLSLKWAYPVGDVEITDTSSSPTLSRLLAAGLNKSGSLNSSRIPEESYGSNNVDSLVQEMNNLMHDYEVLSRISALVSTFKGSYEGLNSSVVQQVGSSIQRAIHQKDEQMVWVDSCCLQFCVKTKDGKEKETFTFQTDNPTVKKDWVVELRLAQLALDRNNSPAWDLPDHVRTPSTKLPLFVKALPVFSSKHQTEVKCGCCYTVTPSRPTRSSGRQLMYLWLCSSDGISSYLTICQMQQVGLRELTKVDLPEMCVSALQHVPALGTGVSGGNDELPLRSHTVWMGTTSHRLILYSGHDPERQIELNSTSVPAAITTIKYHCDQVYVGLSNGSVQVYRRGTDGAWLLNDPIVISLGKRPITALLPISTHVYASCGNQVHVIDCFTAQVMREFGVQHDDSKEVFLMAHSGIGLWIAQEKSSTICLYHTETFRHLQDINVASNVSRMLTETGNIHTPAKIYVTALIASKGLLWVGTNVGVALTIPLPRLEGIPIISGRANISFHAHLGPITFLLALQSQSGRPTVSIPPPDVRFNSNELNTENSQFHPDVRSSTVPPTPSARLEKQQSDGSLLSRKLPQPRLKQQLSSPVMIRRRPREPREQARRLSKTLPRNVGGMALSGSQECDVYGLCGALLNVQSYEDDSIGTTECGSLGLSRYDSMRRSDPELAIPEQLNTLDRRLRLKASRPRSLDLSTWSVDSRASSACTTASSGSEEGGAGGGLSPAIVKRSSNGTAYSQRNGTSTFKRKENDFNRTLMVVMGGRGYINLQKCDPSSPLPPNTKDAHIVVWEMKL